MLRSVLRTSFVSLPLGVCLPLRILALVLLAGGASSAAGAQEAAADSRWQFTRTADPIAGGSIAMARVNANGADALVRCWTKSRELDLRFLLTPGSGRAVSEKVTIGFDQRRSAERTWRVSPSGLALVVPMGQRRQLLQRLQEAGQMRLSVQTNTAGNLSSDSAGTQFSIPLAGSSRAIASVLRACN